MYNWGLGVPHHAVAHIHHGNDLFCVYSQQTRGPATDTDMNDVLLKWSTWCFTACVGNTSGY